MGDPEHEQDEHRRQCRLGLVAWLEAAEAVLPMCQNRAAFFGRIAEQWERLNAL